MWKELLAAEIAHDVVDEGSRPGTEDERAIDSSAYGRGDIPGHCIRKCYVSIWIGSGENVWPKGCGGSYDHAARDRRTPAGDAHCSIAPVMIQGAIISGLTCSLD